MGLNSKYTNKIRSTDGVYFDERLHKYYYKDKELESVTKWIGEYFCEPFEKNNRHIFISQGVSKSNKKKGKGITDPDLQRKVWKLNGERTSANGTSAHAFVQMVHIHKQFGEDIEPDTGYEQAIKNAYEHIIKSWEIVELEKQVFSVDYLLAGHLDGLIRHKKTKQLGILDWKTFKDVNKSHNKMQNELASFAQTPLLKTAIQLAVYNKLGNFDIKSENRYLIQLFNDGSYKVYGGKKKPLQDVDSEVQRALDKRYITKNNTIIGLV